MTKRPKSRDARIATARALLALAERGEANERENARIKLDAFMKKYALDIQDVEQWHVKPQLFPVPVHSQWLFVQVATSILGQVPLAPTDDGESIVLHCADEDIIHIRTMFEFFMAHYDEELRIFQAAFVQANGLFPALKMKYPPDAKVERSKNPPPPPPVPTHEEEEEIVELDADQSELMPDAEDFHSIQMRIDAMSQWVKRRMFRTRLS